MPEEKRVPEPAVIALAGRRIDAPGTDPPRFPLNSLTAVRSRLAQAFVHEHAMALVCSAACGADLVALEEAERLGLRRRIVLPFSPERFREASVTDRPGNWGPVFDRLVAAAKAAGDLLVLGELGGSDDAAYAAANVAIVREAQALSRAVEGGRTRRLLALIVWEGKARAGTDATGDFRSLVAQAGFEECVVLTR